VAGSVRSSIKVVAGTSIADTGLATTSVEFGSVVQPIINKRPDLWQKACSTLEAFVYAAGMVQSRAFHLRQENWVTGQSHEGGCSIVVYISIEVGACLHSGIQLSSCSSASLGRGMHML
jgi:hypothetical protein